MKYVKTLVELKKLNYTNNYQQNPRYNRPNRLGKFAKTIKSRAKQISQVNKKQLKSTNN